MIVVLMVVVFLLLILPHEVAHFLAARASGMRVERLSVGFGPRIWGFKRKATEYVISAVPIGGYVKIAGMERGDTSVADGFYSKPVTRQLAVVIAGSAMNFLLAAVLFAVVFMAGYQAPDLQRPTVGSVIAESPAAEAGLQAGDTIVRLDGERITEWEQISASLDRSEEDVHELLVQRDGRQLALTIEPRYYAEYGRELIGIAPTMRTIRQGPLQAFAAGGRQVVVTIGAIVDGLWRMVTGAQEIDVAGPVGIAGYVGQASQYGLTSFLALTALLSINLGLINLAPIPALDGGRVVFILVEAVRKKPIKMEFQELVHYVGFVILIALMLFVTYRDIARLLP